MTPAKRVAARFKQAGFIPDKFWKRKKDELKQILLTPLDEPYDVVWAIRDKLAAFYGLFQDDLRRYGLNRHAYDTVKMRIDTQTHYLDRLSESYEALRKEFDSAPYPRESAVDEIAVHIAVKLKGLFEEQLPVLGKALKVMWVIQPGSVMALANKIAKKATPEELAAVEKSRQDDYSNAVLDVKYRFFNRVNLDGQTARLIKKEKVDRDYVKWFDMLRDVILVNYGEEGLDKAESFDDFMVGNLKVILLDRDISPLESKRYAAKFVESQALLKQKGFGKLWYGVFFVTSREYKQLSPYEQERYRELGYESLESQAGTYHSGEDVVKLTTPPGQSFVGTIVHEMGHRYWYRFMNPAQRARFNDLVKTNPSKVVRDLPSGPKDQEGLEKGVVPVSDYGFSSIEEAFAEAFKHYVLGDDMNRDQLESFRSVLAAQRVAERYADSLAGPGDVERWRKDLRLMTKIYKSIEPESDERNLALWAEGERLFRKFKENFNQWVYRVVLPLVEKDRETYVQKQIRKEAGDAIYTIDPSMLFPTRWGGEGQPRVPDLPEFRHARERNITRYQKAFNKVLKTLDDYFASGGKTSPFKDEQYEVAGMSVLVQGYGRGGFEGREEDLDRVLRNLRDLVAPVIRAGFKKATQGLKVVIDYNPGPGEGLTNAKYSPGPDRMLIYGLGLAGQAGGTIAHELGHRYWFKEMSGQARTHWDDVISNSGVTITSDNIDEFLKVVVAPLVRNGFGPDTDEMRRRIKSLALPDIKKAVFYDLSKVTTYQNGDPYTDEAQRKSLDQLRGTVVLLEEISDYAAEGGPIEAFAEAFRLYTTKGPGSLGPITLDLFKRVVATGGVRLAHNALLGDTLV